jgi:hypothetical protein
MRLRNRNGFSLFTTRSTGPDVLLDNEDGLPDPLSLLFSSPVRYHVVVGGL